MAMALLLAWATAGNLVAQQQPPAPQQGPTQPQTTPQAQSPPLQQQQPPPPPSMSSRGVLKVTTEIVLVNVVARDRRGELIKDLKKDDFTLFEDGKKQDVASFDFEKVDEMVMAGAAGNTVTGTAEKGGGLLNTKVQKSLDARDRRLMLMFFDFSAAIVAHLAVGDSAIWLMGPITCIIALAASWALRPKSRRLAGTSSAYRFA